MIALSNRGKSTTFFRINNENSNSSFSLDLHTKFLSEQLKYNHSGRNLPSDRPKRNRNNSQLTIIQVQNDTGCLVGSVGFMADPAGGFTGSRQVAEMRIGRKTKYRFYFVFLTACTTFVAILV
ncbi:MAG: hypothetical protein LBH77_09795 [Tannerella sp.]|jgi:hypothetical protein|nr:hypothetical protein [Tannerella sp.]